MAELAAESGASLLAVNEQRTFPNDATSVTAARHLVIELLTGVPDEIREAAALMLSELATNCIRHAREGFVLRLRTTDDLLRVDVTDAGAGRPRTRTPALLEPTGRGLHIVNQLAKDWGVSMHRNGGKTVWFTLDLARRTALSDAAGPEA